MTRGLRIAKFKQQGADEPVTIEELKGFLAIDSDDHDELLYSLIKSAREEVENYTGLSLIKSNVIAKWESLDTAELPFGPVLSLDSVKDKDGETIVSDKFYVEGIMGSFVNIKADTDSSITFAYVAGYDASTIPEGLKLAIMKNATDDFEQRTGVDTTGKMSKDLFPNNWKSKARKYSRRSCWE